MEERENEPQPVDEQDGADRDEGTGHDDGENQDDGDEVEEGFTADLLRQATITGEPGNTADTGLEEPPAANAMPAASDDDT